MTNYRFAEDAAHTISDRIKGNIPINVNTLDKILADIRYHLTYRKRISPMDADMLRDVVAQASYVRVLMLRIQATEGDTVPEKYNFTPAFDDITKLVYSKPDGGSDFGELSMVSVTIISERLDDIVEEYYHPKGPADYKPSLWEAFMGLFARKDDVHGHV